MEKFLDAVKEAMFRPINAAAISILGIFSTLWGIWVANPFWDVFTQAQIFESMRWIMPEWTWGLTAFAVGATMVYGVYKKSYLSLRNGALAGFYFWLFGSINFFVGDWRNTGGITLLMIAFYCGYVALNLRINREYFIESE